MCRWSQFSFVRGWFKINRQLHLHDLRLVSKTDKRAWWCCYGSPSPLMVHSAVGLSEKLEIL